MSVRSYVLVETDVGTARQVALELQGLGGLAADILSVEMVTGPFDVICLLEAENLERLGACITDGIQTVNGVKRTTTCLTIAITGN